MEFPWIKLTDVGQIPEIEEKSKTKPQVIFKHSTRCGTSGIALRRFEKADAIPAADFYFLDLIRYREVSNAVADKFDVYHESPQVLVISKGACIYDESHLGIHIDELSEVVNAAD